MSRPTEDDLEYAENADIGRHGCLLPNGDAADYEDSDSDGDDDDE
jgi:hypothetical protein